jgi:hypothetical protein
VCVRIGSTGMAWHGMVWGRYVRQRHVRRLRRLTGLEVLITCSSDPEGGSILANCELRAVKHLGAFVWMNAAGWTRVVLVRLIGYCDDGTCNVYGL